jgi:hypothetical protein
MLVLKSIANIGQESQTNDEKLLSERFCLFWSNIFSPNSD